MPEYYYFVASLPLLRRNEPPPLGTADFIEACERLLSPADSAQIRLARTNLSSLAPSRIPLLRRFQQAEFGLRNELVRLRAKQRGVDQVLHLRSESIDPTWAAAAREIAEKETPLLAEERMSALLWDVLDDLSVGHFFDLDLLAAYFLKLQLLERMVSFDERAGRQRLETMLAEELKDV